MFSLWYKLFVFTQDIIFRFQKSAVVCTVALYRLAEQFLTFFDHIVPLANRKSHPVNFCFRTGFLCHLGTHGMFICSVTEARVMSNQETMTYTYYQNNVKPKPETEGKKGFVCKVCGYIYEGDELPADYICPLCKHGAADFEPIG